jgi:hypothetical protein
VGLLTTCGLQNVGAPSEGLDGSKHGIHGGISTTPATDVNVQTLWEGDECYFTVSGNLREVTERGLFGPHLCLHRTWRMQLGSNTIELHDELENEGFTPAPAMLLYHFNIGWSVVDEGSRLITASRTVQARDKSAEQGLVNYASFGAPVAGYQEQVFYHEQIPDAQGKVRVGIVSPERSNGRIAVFLEYDQAALKRFTQWKQLGAGAYVCGLEPSNCTINGQAWEQQQGTLPALRPGEKRSYRLKLEVTDCSERIDALTQQIRLLKS